MTIAPIFSLGAPRTGTTWIGNILKDHFPVYSMHHFLHYGNHEADFYRMEKYRQKVDRSTFLEQFKKTDIYQLNALEEEVFPNDWDSYYHLFFDLMDKKAKAEGKESWTTKLCHDYFYFPRQFANFRKAVNERYENTKYVVIRRDMEQTLISFINLFGKYRERRLKNEIVSLYLFLARYKTFYANIHQYLPESHLVEYEDLKEDFQKTVTQIGGYLEMVPFFGKETGIRNTSVRTKAEVKRPWYLFENRLLLKGILNLWEVLKPSRPAMHCRLKLFEEDPQELISQMRASGNDIIADLVEKELAKKAAKE
ncbi:MAG: sulfotransferase [Pirellulaceae bacterium]|nr:sulfotransferase [Pirellulaceae bacterium]